MTARKSARKGAGKSARKTSRKTARKSPRKTARKATRKTAAPSVRKTARKALRRVSKEGAQLVKRARRVAAKAMADIGDASVRARTGKTWAQWFALIDRARVGAKRLEHGKIVEIVGRVKGVSGWWQQMISVAYERARGLRRKYQTKSGFNASSSKTMDVPLADVYDQWADESKRQLWLGAPAPALRKAIPQRSLRLTWHDGSWVNVGFASKADGRTQVALSHERLPNAKAVATYKTFWKEALARLQAAFSTPATP